ncbi:hypothetical protein LT493_23150 [Streptomyces tricolor]|nr:hypothetical protein [Streptomyces tricolor]
MPLPAGGDRAVAVPRGAVRGRRVQPERRPRILQGQPLRPHREGPLPLPLRRPRPGHRPVRGLAPVGRVRRRRGAPDPWAQASRVRPIRGPRHGRAVPGGPHDRRGAGRRLAGRLADRHRGVRRHPVLGAGDPQNAVPVCRACRWTSKRCRPRPALQLFQDRCPGAPLDPRPRELLPAGVDGRPAHGEPAALAPLRAVVPAPQD